MPEEFDLVRTLMPPLHVQCRCVMVLVFGDDVIVPGDDEQQSRSIWADQGINVEENMKLQAAINYRGPMDPDAPFHTSGSDPAAVSFDLTEGAKKQVQYALSERLFKQIEKDPELLTSLLDVPWQNPQGKGKGARYDEVREWFDLTARTDDIIALEEFAPSAEDVASTKVEGMSDKLLGMVRRRSPVDLRPLESYTRVTWEELHNLRTPEQFVFGDVLDSMAQLLLPGYEPGSMAYQKIGIEHIFARGIEPVYMRLSSPTLAVADWHEGLHQSTIVNQSAPYVDPTGSGKFFFLLDTLGRKGVERSLLQAVQDDRTDIGMLDYIIETALPSKYKEDVGRRAFDGIVSDWAQDLGVGSAYDLRDALRDEILGLRLDVRPILARDLRSGVWSAADLGRALFGREGSPADYSGAIWALLSSKRGREYRGDIQTQEGVAPIFEFPWQNMVADRVRTLVHQWAESSDGRNSLSNALQIAVGATLLDRSPQDVLDQLMLTAEEDDEDTRQGSAVYGRTWYQRSKKALDAFIQSMYDETQAWFKGKGITHVNVWRGVGESGMGDSAGDYFLGQLSLRPASSAASWLRTAHGWKTHMFGLRTAVENVLSTPWTGFGCLDENEVVLLGTAGEETVYAVNTGAKTRKVEQGLTEYLDWALRGEGRRYRKGLPAEPGDRRPTDLSTDAQFWHAQGVADRLELEQPNVQHLLTPFGEVGARATGVAASTLSHALRWWAEKALPPPVLAWLKLTHAWHENRYMAYFFEATKDGWGFIG